MNTTSSPVTEVLCYRLDRLVLAILQLLHSTLIPTMGELLQHSQCVFIHDTLSKHVYWYIYILRVFILILYQRGECRSLVSGAMIGGEQCCSLT